MIRLVSAALADTGKTGGQCKAWVQAVILRATGITVPLNAGAVAERWQKDNSGKVLSLGSAIAQSRPGDAVQMIIRDRNDVAVPHTAFVGENDGAHIRWIESNYRGDEKVTAHRRQSHQDFHDATIERRYTVYRILA